MFTFLKKKFYNLNWVSREFVKYNSNYSDILRTFKSLFAKDNLGRDDLKLLLDTSKVDVNKFKNKKFVQISTYNKICGIATFCKSLKNGLNELRILDKNDVLPIDINLIRNSSFAENVKYYDEISNKCYKYDYVILQHEFGFFYSTSYSLQDNIEIFYKVVHKLSLLGHIKVLVYLHTSFFALDLFNKNIKEATTIIDKAKKFSELNNVYFIANSLDIINDMSIFNIKVNLGIDPIKKHYKINSNTKINFKLKNNIKKQLDLSEDDIVLMMLGFINSTKRHDEMCEILALLPKNYKLLIVGGIAKGSDDIELRKLHDKIKNLKLNNRVYITGLFQDKDLNTYFSMAHLMCAPYTEVSSGSGSIPALLVSNKPVIAYKTKMIESVNSQCNYRPIIEIEYDNRAKFAKKIIELSNKNSQEYIEVCNNIKNYSSVMNDKKLAELVLKAFG